MKNSVDYNKNIEIKKSVDGVDTVAEYFLNDEKIGSSENMFISHIRRN